VTRQRFSETYFSREHRFSLGNDLKTGGHYLAIPVSSGVVDYDEQYFITAAQFLLFSDEPTSALDFVEACRRREHDDVLIYSPNKRRGSPI
jgi:hypothetical protein